MNKYYDSLKYKNLYFDKILTTELVFGIISGLKILNNFTRDKSNFVEVKESNKNYYEKIYFDNIKIIFKSVELLELNNFKGFDDKYSLWVKNLENNKYDLYNFKTKDFLIGFISMFFNFNIDFRLFIKGHPFKFINGKVIKYFMDEYDL